MARMSAYDTAFKMQTEAAEVFDLSKEPKETLDQQFLWPERDAARYVAEAF
jgi:Protein of unknown function (DUF1501)